MPEPPPTRSIDWRRVLAIGLSTVIMVFAYGMILFALTLVGGDEQAFAGGVMGIGLGLVPGAFLAAAFVSLNPRAFRSTVFAVGLWALVSFPIAVFDVATGLVAGFGAGGVVAFRLDEGVHTRRSRILAVTGCAAYTFILLRVSPAAGLLGGAPLPFIAIGVVDAAMERRARLAEETPRLSP